MSATTAPVQPRLLGVKQAAAYLGATVWYIRSIIWDKKIPSLRLGKRDLLDIADLDAFVASQKRAAR
jgi:excisionase family DNA binding protein